MQDFAARLLAWFDQHGRKNLPWQQDITPYRVWVSEIMLQQTQVTTVIPYYDNFMARFPRLEILANASQDEVLHLWTGLGYYARARNLHKTAQQVVADYNGVMPLTQAELETLPGIGRSTAAAIVAICTGQRAAILDGNVKRVLARVFRIDGWPGQTTTLKALWQQAEQLTPDQRVPDYTQAIMDLGAMVCTRSSPRCQLCPFESSCGAYQTQTIDQYPGRKPKKDLPVRQVTMLVIESRDGILLEKRPQSGIWGGLWSFPELTTEAEVHTYAEKHGLRIRSTVSLPPLRHTFSHYHLDIQPLHLKIADSSGIREPEADATWFKPENPKTLGLSGVVTKILESR